MICTHADADSKDWGTVCVVAGLQLAMATQLTAPDPSLEI